jgi:hypothetical protein
MKKDLNEFVGTAAALAMAPAIVGNAAGIWLTHKQNQKLKKVSKELEKTNKKLNTSLSKSKEKKENLTHLREYILSI